MFYCLVTLVSQIRPRKGIFLKMAKSYTIPQNCYIIKRSNGRKTGNELLKILNKFGV